MGEPGILGINHTGTQRRPLTALQKVALLLLNLAETERELVLQSLPTNARPRVAPDAEEVLQACRDVYACASPEQRGYIVGCAAQFANLLQWQQEDFEARLCDAQIVATIPEFLYLAREGALPPIEHGSLEAGMARVACTARERLDLSIPYISRSGVEILTAGLTARSRRGLRVGLLSLLTSPHLEQNRPGVMSLAERFDWAGASVEIRSPTDAQAVSTGAIATMHAKMVIGDGCFAYLGTGNVSLSGLVRGFEVGVLLRRVLARNLWNLFDWAFQRHEIWTDPGSVAS